MGRNLVKEHVVILTHNLKVDNALADPQKSNPAMQALVLFMVNGQPGLNGPIVVAAVPEVKDLGQELVLTLPPPTEVKHAKGTTLKQHGAG